jgi:hypothetical protein
MATSTSKGVRVAAGFVCAFFVAFVLIHLLWAVGITWGLDAVSAGQGELDASIALTIVSLIAAAAGIAVIVVTAARVGWCKTPLSDRLIRIGGWVVFSWPFVGTLNPATPWAQRPVTIPLAIAAFVVARSRPLCEDRPHGSRVLSHDDDQPADRRGVRVPRGRDERPEVLAARPGDPQDNRWTARRRHRVSEHGQGRRHEVES